MELLFELPVENVEEQCIYGKRNVMKFDTRNSSI